MSNHALPDSFLWGGATAANQFEGGGKGLSVQDVTSGGDRTYPRHVTDGILPPGKDVPIGVAVQTDESWDDPQKRYTALHHQLVAGAKAVQLEHRINPDFKVGCMLLGRVAYPYTCKPDDVLEAQQVMRQANYYCGDVQARGAYPAFSKWLWKKEGVSVAVRAEDAEALRNGAVDFIIRSPMRSRGWSSDSS